MDTRIIVLTDYLNFYSMFDGNYVNTSWVSSIYCLGDLRCYFCKYRTAFLYNHYQILYIFSV